MNATSTSYAAVRMMPVGQVTQPQPQQQEQQQQQQEEQQQQQEEQQQQQQAIRLSGRQLCH
jgi:hypothetical protein